MNYYQLPNIYEKEGRYEKSWDIYSRLLKDRIIFIGNPINDFIANSIIAQLLFLQMNNSKKDIHIYINCSGGEISSGIAIYDTMNFVNCKISTYCIGQAAGLGALLLSSGSKGKRFSLPNSRIILHQPFGIINGQCEDIKIKAEETLRNKRLISKIFSKNTNKPFSKIEKDFDREFYMNAEKAKKYGIIDKKIDKTKN
jgi:ATP-dependent Clp protease protease subunit